MIPALVLLALLPGIDAATTCKNSRCLSALRDPTRTADASSLCSSVLETRVAPTASDGFPAWATPECGGTTSLVPKLSKACSRFLSSTAWPGSDTRPWTCPAATTVTKTITRASGSCSAEVTVTLPPLTLTEPGVVTTTTTTEPASVTTTTTTTTEPASVTTTTTTTTEPASVTTTTTSTTESSTTTTTTTESSTTTTTTTATVTARTTCDQPLSNVDFENPSRALYPWRGFLGASGPGTGGGLNQEFFGGPVSFAVRLVRGTTPDTQNPLVRLEQGTNVCAGTYSVHVRYQVRDTAAQSPGGFTLQTRLISMAGTSVQSNFVAVAETTPTWREATYGTWQVDESTRLFQVDFVANAPWDGDNTIWVDTLELVRV